MTPRVLWRSCAVLALAFAGLALAVMVAGSLPGEHRLLVAVSSVDALDPLARAVDRWTGYRPVGALAGLLGVGLLLLGRSRDAVLLGLSVGGAMAGNVLLKSLVDRPRPDTVPADVDVSALSFPSGHAAATAAIAAAVVLMTLGTRRLLVTLLATGAVVVVAGTAQLLLGLHHPSDVAAGCLWASAWTTAVWSAAARAPGQPR